jgi:hypothetical protein
MRASPYRTKSLMAEAFSLFCIGGERGNQLVVFDLKERDRSIVYLKLEEGLLFI